jgi:hypothetical protein
VISGYVYQDGEVILSVDGEVPENRRTIRDGIRTEDDTPIGSVRVELRTITGQLFPSSATLPGTYSGDTVVVETDANGYFEFTGLRKGVYHIYQDQPKDFIDSLDTPGTLGGFSVNPEDEINNAFAQQTLSNLAASSETDPGRDAILLVQVGAGQHTQENNFSEIRIRQTIAPPPPEPPTPGNNVPDWNPLVRELVRVIPPPLQPLDALPLIAPGGSIEPYTWHLSVINAGTPRGDRADKFVSQQRIAEATTMLDVTHWTVAGLDRGKWKIVATGQEPSILERRNVFTLQGATPLAGDFNGDGIDEIALFYQGEWLLDVNGNGRWDNDDLWARLGDKQDLPVVGDWDADGKDDIGIYGPEWQGDRLAIAREPGLPDPENENRSQPKNIPEEQERFLRQERLLQRNRNHPGRSDVIDHVFGFGGDTEQPVAGDFNGDGIASVGVMHNGRWRVDVDGDGRWTERDDDFYFGGEGDIALVGDFNGDGIDEVAIVRGSMVIVDSNGNHKVDATDKVFEMNAVDGDVVIGDFDGDGIDEPIIHRSEIADTAPKSAMLPTSNY